LAISRKRKEELIAEYAQEFSRSNAIILSDYRGLRATDINRLRNEMRKVGSGYHVTKNRLVKLALKEAGLPPLESLLDGPTAIGFCYQEVPPAAKVLVDFADEFDTFSVKGGLLGGKFVSAERIVALAKLPSREVLLAQALAGMEAPLSGLVGVLSGVLRGLLNVFKARADQLGSASGVGA